MILDSGSEAVIDGSITWRPGTSGSFSVSGVYHLDFLPAIYLFHGGIYGAGSSVSFEYGFLFVRSFQMSIKGRLLDGADSLPVL